MAVDRRVTTQDISWFLDLSRNGQLNLDPPYQRRSVWSPKDRRFFLGGCRLTLHIFVDVGYERLA